MLTFATAFPSTLSRVAVVALGACGCTQSLGMAGPTPTAAVIDAAASLIGDPRVRTFIDRRPVTGRMAGGTVQPKHTCMEDRIAMAA